MRCRRQNATGSSSTSTCEDRTLAVGANPALKFRADVHAFARWNALALTAKSIAPFAHATQPRCRKEEPLVSIEKEFNVVNSNDPVDDYVEEMVRATGRCRRRHDGQIADEIRMDRHRVLDLQGPTLTIGFETDEARLTSSHAPPQLMPPQPDFAFVSDFNDARGPKASPVPVHSPRRGTCVTAGRLSKCPLRRSWGRPLPTSLS